MRASLRSVIRFVSLLCRHVHICSGRFELCHSFPQLFALNHCVAMAVELLQQRLGRMKGKHDALQAAELFHAYVSCVSKHILDVDCLTSQATLLDIKVQRNLVYSKAAKLRRESFELERRRGRSQDLH